MKDQKLKIEILTTLSFFHIFQHPLTDFEIWKFLLRESAEEGIELSEVKNIIKQMEAEKKIVENNGFYSLYLQNSGTLQKESLASPGKGEMGQERLERTRIAMDKFKKAVRISDILKRIPGIKMVAICNSLALNHAHKESDIDLFIITQKNKLWTTRLLVLATLELLRLRPEKKNHADKICASFFISEESIDLEEIKMNGKDLDIYLIYWAATLIFLYEKDDMHKIFSQRNSWLKKILPNWKQHNLSRDFSPNPLISYLFHVPFALGFLCPEYAAKKLQMAIMPDKLKQLANKGTSVIINDKMLKFHDKDRRKEYLEKWKHIFLSAQYETKK